MIEAALFPIPKCVVFPGVVFPLHVFEPRYRKMVNHCIDNHLLMAIAHTQKVVKESKANQSLEEALRSNQSTYKPQQVFSAGYCELMETLPDGRMRVDVHIEQRLKFEEEVQTLPFVIAHCTELLDEVEDLQEAAILQEKVLQRLRALVAKDNPLSSLINDDQWESKDPSQFSFEIFSFMRFDASLLQDILESRSVAYRLNAVLTTLNTL